MKRAEKLVNLTPHEINVVIPLGDDIAIPPSGVVARVAVVATMVDNFCGVPIYGNSTGEVIGLPDPREGTCFIVSKMVVDADTGRADLLSPGKLIRDEKGRVIGCEGLCFSKQ